MSAAGKLDIPAYRFGGELASAEAATAHGIGADGALLVRPDGVVAWRSPQASPDAAREVDQVLRAVLHR